MYDTDLERAARENTAFRRVLHTGKSQLVLMSLAPGEDIGEETHDTIDQTFFVIDGMARAVVDGEVRRLPKGQVLVVPAGARHNVECAGPTDLKLATIYAPPAHPDGTVHQTKADAQRAEVGA